MADAKIVRGLFKLFDSQGSLVARLLAKKKALPVSNSRTLQLGEEATDSNKPFKLLSKSIANRRTIANYIFTLGAKVLNRRMEQGLFG